MIVLAREEGQFGVRVGGLTGVRCYEMGLSFLVEGVRNPPATTTHAVHRD